METTNNEFETLLQKYADGRLSKQEFDLLLSYVRDSEHTQILDKVVDRDWAEMGMEYPYSAGASEKLFENIKSDQRYIQGFERLENQAKVVRLVRWKRIAVAAAVATVIFGSGLFYYYKQSVKTGQTTVYVNDVAPGIQGATLTLANGQRILIKDALAGNIANQSGVKISKGADGQIIYEVTDVKSDALEYNTLSTTRGEHTQVRLPDGSTVFLNAASSLKYPTSFARSETRRVSLTGEGYFEISKDKAHPFIVSTDKQEVQVLGTHFNINAYPDEPAVATTLLEGSVKISSFVETSVPSLRGTKQPNKAETILKPGFQAVNDGSAIKVARANVENITDWKDGDFNLDGLDFRLAMRKIGRWYDVEVVYESGVPEGIETGGWISRNNKLSDVLRLIEKSGFVHFRVEGKKLYVSK